MSIENNHYWKPDYQDYADLTEVATKYKETRLLTKKLINRVKDPNLVKIFLKLDVDCLEGINAIATFFGNTQKDKFLELLEKGRPYSDDEN